MVIEIISQKQTDIDCNPSIVNQFKAVYLHYAWVRMSDFKTNKMLILSKKCKTGTTLKMILMSQWITGICGMRHISKIITRNACCATFGTKEGKKVAQNLASMIKMVPGIKEMPR